MTRRIITQRQTSREQHEQEAERRGGNNYDWDAVVAKTMDPARKPSEAARPAGTAGKVETVDDFEAAAYERRHKALAAAMAGARRRGASETAIASAIDRAIDSGSDLAVEVSLVGRQE